MARFNHRTAAGVGVFAAFLLLGTPATVAVAHPGGSHSDRGNNSDRGNDRSNGRGGNGRDGNWPGSNDVNRKRGPGDAGFGSAPPGPIGVPPQSRIGSGRDDVVDVEDVEDVAESDPGIPPGFAARSAAPEQSEARVSAAEPSEARSSAFDASEVPTSGSAPNVFGGAEPPSRSGSNRADVPETRFDSPPVTVGNGRDPVTARRAPEPQWQAPALHPVPAAPAPALPPPAAPAPQPARVERAPEAPVLTQQLGVAPTPGWSNPLWGLAGLLLIPVAGAALGYRQARAAHAAERLRRT